MEATLLRAHGLAVAGRMSASIAHEINNPLEAVTNLLYLMRSEVTGELHPRTLQGPRQSLHGSRGSPRRRWLIIAILQNRTLWT
jgi:signal transduction histidine kinase